MMGRPLAGGPLAGGRGSPAISSYGCECHPRQHACTQHRSPCSPAGRKHSRWWAERDCHLLAHGQPSSPAPYLLQDEVQADTLLPVDVRISQAWKLLRVSQAHIDTRAGKTHTRKIKKINKSKRRGRTSHHRRRWHSRSKARRLQGGVGTWATVPRKHGDEDQDTQAWIHQPELVHWNWREELPWGSGRMREGEKMGTNDRTKVFQEIVCERMSVVVERRC